MSSVEARIQEEADRLAKAWMTDPRWRGVQREHSAEDVVRLRGSLQWDYPVARHGARVLWRRIHGEEGDAFVRALGAQTANQAVQMVRAGLKAIYVSGWQVAADANLGETMYPDQSLYPMNSVPALVRRINNALKRADQVEWAEGEVTRDWFAPIVADAEAGFGGPLNAFELMKGMIKAGAAGVHFEDQLASEKKCGHMGGKVLVPTAQAIRQLKAARLAADVYDVPTIIIARTDARAANLLTSEVDPRDHTFLTGHRTPEGYHRVDAGMDQAIARGVAYAPYADLVWCETSTPDLDEAKRFAQAIRREHPGKLLAYNCSPSFNWKRHLDDEQIAAFQEELGKMGYTFQFITLAGFHAMNHAMFDLASGYRDGGMSAYVKLQEVEFESEKDGYTATKHQREVGAGYFDAVSRAINGADVSTLAMEGSTESEQFHVSPHSKKRRHKRGLHQSQA